MMIRKRKMSAAMRDAAKTDRENDLRVMRQRSARAEAGGREGTEQGKGKEQTSTKQ